MNTKVTISALVLLAAISFGWYFYRENSTVGIYDEFAQCIADSGAKFYGAFWCPHCQTQKKMFGKSERLLPYIECSSPNGQSQLQVCTDAGVNQYPTWEFTDGSRLTGEVELATLADKTGCSLPQ